MHHSDSSASGRRSTRLSLWLLMLVSIIAGSYLRLSGIGEWGFWTDELFHVFAAQSYLNDGSFGVPWRPEEYTRAMPVTLLVAISFHLFGESETSARVVFALINVVFIIIAFPIVRRLFSRNVAVIFVIFMSFSNFAIGQSRECRMYTLFQLFYFLMSVAFFYGLEFRKRRIVSPRADFLDRMQARVSNSWLYMLMAFGAGLVALQLHTLTLTFTFVAFAYALTLLFKESSELGIFKALRSRYGALLSIFVLAAVFVAAILSGLFGNLLAMAGFDSSWLLAGMDDFLREAFVQPVWYQTQLSNASFYYHVMVVSHPYLWAMLPISLFLAIYRYGNAGIFFALSFIVLFALHSFVFVGRQLDRYIFYILPFFLVISAIGAETLLAALISISRGAVLQLSRGLQRVFLLAVGMSIALLFQFNMEDWYGRMQWLPPRFADWKNLPPSVTRAVVDTHTISSERFRFSYYFGRNPDYVIDASDTDYAGGDRIVVSLEDLLKALDEFPDAVVVTHSNDLFNDASVGPEVRTYLLTEMRRLDSEDDERIMLFKR